jgi:hypothetical protein
MDTTALRQAYETLLDTAARPDLGEAADGGWDADRVLAHLLIVDAGIAAAALGVVSGARPVFDNRLSQDPANLARVIGAHAGRAELIERVRAQAAVLCDIADRIDEREASVLVPALLVSSGDIVVDQPVPLAGLIGGLADNHVPEHTAQLLALRPTAAAGA